MWCMVGHNSYIILYYCHIHCILLTVIEQTYDTYYHNEILATINIWSNIVLSYYQSLPYSILIHYHVCISSLSVT